MIYITGDIHGNSKDYRLEKVKALNKKDIIIFLGDFGFNWRKGMENLYNANCETLFIAGNHENFNILNNLPKSNRYGGEVRILKDNVYYLPTGNIYTIEGKKFFVFGGASSTDKILRTPYVSWWPEEVPSWQEFEFAKENLEKNNNKIDYLLTHTCATSISKKFFNYQNSFKDPTEDMIQELENQIQSPYINYFGHHHVTKREGNHICLYTDIEELEEL